MQIVDLGVEVREVLAGVGAAQRVFGSVALREREVVAMVLLVHGVGVGRGGKRSPA